MALRVRDPARAKILPWPEHLAGRAPHFSTSIQRGGFVLSVALAISGRYLSRVRCSWAETNATFKERDNVPQMTCEVILEMKRCWQRGDLSRRQILSPARGTTFAISCPRSVIGMCVLCHQSHRRAGAERRA